jgi:NAD dependent epimerase/dehydratase family enzyme
MAERAEVGRARRVKRIILKKAEEDDRREAGKKLAQRFDRLRAKAQSSGVRPVLCRTAFVLEERGNEKKYEQEEKGGGRSVRWDGKG